MSHRARFPFLAVAVFIAIIQISACSGKPSTFYQVSITPAGPLNVAQNSSSSISASVLNDTANGGVTFSIVPTGIGTLTQNSSSSATYVAPPSVQASTSVIVTATSVDFPGSSSSITINIQPPPTITTTSLPTGSVNIDYPGSITAAGGVPPLTWTLASGALPAGLSLGSSTSNTVNIVGKPTADGVSTFTVKVTDAVGETATSQSLQIVISTLAITTTSPLPPATFSTPPTNYSQQFAASGGTTPYTWTVASGSTLPAGLSLSSTGLLSGAPTVQGSFTFGITVTDAGTPPASVTQQFTLVINGPSNAALLTGPYAFIFNGNNANGFVAVAGTFTADGNGNITTGEEDFNSIAQNSAQSFTDITGTYTLGSDGRGKITFANLPTPATYAFSVDSSGKHGRIIEFDSTGTRGSGRIEAQSVSTCTVTSTSSTYSGTFAYGGVGYASNLGGNLAGPISFAGVFSATTPLSPSTVGSISNGEADADVAGTIFSPGSASGTGLYQSGTDATHCVFQIQSAFPQSMTYNAYPISSGEAFMIETDQISATSPYVTTLDMLQQFGYPFLTQGTITSSLGGGLVGQYDSGNVYFPEVAVLQISPQAPGTFGLLLTDNSGGGINSNMATSSIGSTPFTVNYSSDQYGRITTNLVSPYQPVLYLVSGGEAFFVSISNGAGFPIIGGLLQPQVVPGNTNHTFDASFLNYDFNFGSAPPPSSAANNITGFLTFDGVSSVTGLEDISSTTGNASAQPYTGTYAVLDQVFGTGTVAPVAPSTFAGEYVILSPTRVVMITTTPGDANPILLELGH